MIPLPCCCYAARFTEWKGRYDRKLIRIAEKLVRSTGKPRGKLRLMDGNLLEKPTPPPEIDIDEGLDAYDKELAETFPASDVPESAHP